MQNQIDIIVVGGGVIGLCCAIRLALKQKAVCLVEARHCGEGSSKAALGALWPSKPTKKNALQLLHRKALWQIHESIAEFEQLSGVSIGFQRCGRLEAILDENHAKQLEPDIQTANEEWPRFGHDFVMKRLSPVEAKEFEPHAEFGTLGAVQCNISAYLDSTAYVDALKQTAIQVGVYIKEHFHVKELLQLGEQKIGVQSDDATIMAKKILVTTGAWTSNLHPLLKKYAPIMPLKGQALRLKLDRPLIQRIIKKDSIYFLPQENHELILGATTEYGAGFDEQITSEARKQLLQLGQALLPAIQKAEVIGHWAGLRPAPNFRKPIMGPIPGMDNVWVCTGHGKIGLGLAPYIGQLMAEWLVQGKPSESLDAFLPTLH